MSNDHRGQSPLSAGITGALIGVIVGATAVFFSDKKNRDKVKEAIIDFEDHTNQKLEELKLAANSANEESKKKLAANLKKVATQLESSKK